MAARKRPASPSPAKLSITYVVITCRKNEPLVAAQKDTCLKDQQVHVESDTDDLDVRLGVGSTGTKLLRALWRVRSAALMKADWLCFIDDDCWVNTWALDRACSQLDPAKTFIGTVGCPRTGLGKDSGEYATVFGGT